VKLAHAAREVARHRTKATARRAARRYVQSSVNHPAGVIGPLLLARVTLSAAGRGACSLSSPSPFASVRGARASSNRPGWSRTRRRSAWSTPSAVIAKW